MFYLKEKIYMAKKIVVTGGSGRFSKVLKKVKSTHKIFYPTKQELNILNFKKIREYLKKVKPDILIHAAGLSRPMKIHTDDIKKSIDLNIIGTANITKACSEKKIKLIYLSTSYVYPGTKGNYNETDALLPFNNYAWSKLGGEAAVQMYKNSLILRLSMTEKPFVHKKAFTNVKTNFIYHDEVANLLLKLLKNKGIVNVGGKIQSIYNFAKKENYKIKKSLLKKKNKNLIPMNATMDVSKLKKILK